MDNQYPSLGQNVPQYPMAYNGYGNTSVNTDLYGSNHFNPNYSNGIYPVQPNFNNFNCQPDSIRYGNQGGIYSPNLSPTNEYLQQPSPGPIFPVEQCISPEQEETQKSKTRARLAFGALLVLTLVVIAVAIGVSYSNHLG